MNVQKQLDELSLALSAYSQRSPQKDSTPPTFVHDAATAASTITPNDQSYRLMMEDRIKGEKIRQVERANHKKERQLWQQEKAEMI